MKQSAFMETHPLAMAAFATPPGHKLVTAEMTVGVTAEPVGVFADWPQNIIDGVYGALEILNAKAIHTGGPYQLLTAEAGTEDGKAFIKMVAFRYVLRLKAAH